MSDSVQPHTQQPTRLPRPWDSPGKNTGVGCHFLLQCTEVKSESEFTQSCPNLSDPMDCSLPVSSVHGIAELDTTERLHFIFSLLCIGEENGNPLQYSCLENPRDGGAWWAAVYGVTQSRTRLKRLSILSKNASTLSLLTIWRPKCSSRTFYFGIN